MSLLDLILAVDGLLVLSALIAALAARSDRATLAVGTAGSLLACAAGAAAAVAAVLWGDASSLRVAWRLPVGELHLALDALSAFFLICIFTVSGLASLYGSGYLRAYVGRRRVASAVVFFNLLVAAMVLLVLARDAVLFLIAWELMSLASFFLVTFEHEREEVRHAGIVYLVASQVGVVFLFVFFALLARVSSSYDFEVLARAGVSADVAGVCFLLAVVGFGTKAGFWPLHVWLPEAHPAAPSHVSAVMSGVMIKMGIYGLLRALTFLGEPPAWWGIALILIGAVSGITGILHALAQHDLKRILAYSSVENIGIITLGLGVGLLGQAHRAPTIAALGTAGALLHVLNHGLFKGLLFMGAGSVFHATGTRHIDSLGGLGRRMPATALTFLVGSVAISGLPPLNGFIGEWLIYVGAFQGGAALGVLPGSSALLVLPALALIGGLASACFIKAFGVVFLGEPRSAAVSNAHESPWTMRWPMLMAALLCAVIGLWPAGAVELVLPAAVPDRAMFDAARAALLPLAAVTRVALVLLAMILLLALLRRALLRGREVSAAPTWGCGYAAPTPRMQYTGASFAQLVLDPFGAILHTRSHRQGPDGYFPERARFEDHIGDLAGERLLIPGTQRLVRTLSRLRVLQQGRLHLYLVYIAATLVALLVWQLAGAQAQ